MNFRSLYRHGFARVAACTTVCTLADPAANAGAILQAARRCHERAAALAVFPDAEVKCAATRAEAEHLIRRRHFDVAVVDLDLRPGRAAKAASIAPMAASIPAAFASDASTVKAC